MEKAKSGLGLRKWMFNGLVVTDGLVSTGILRRLNSECTVAAAAADSGVCVCVCGGVSHRGTYTHLAYCTELSIESTCCRCVCVCVCVCVRGNSPTGQIGTACNQARFAVLCDTLPSLAAMSRGGRPEAAPWRSSRLPTAVSRDRKPKPDSPAG